MIEKIDQAAILWEKTKDPKYKALWYQYVNGKIAYLPVIHPPDGTKPFVRDW